MSEEAEPCQAVHSEVSGVSWRPSKIKRVYWHIRYRGIIRTFREAVAAMSFARTTPSETAQRPAHATSPRRPPLDLKEGEWVEVRSKAEILETLDSDGKTTGLRFMPEMWPFCGQRFRVYKRMDRFISESTGELRSIRDTVLLEGVICDGSAHFGCGRSCFLWWREAWLKRVED